MKLNRFSSILASLMGPILRMIRCLIFQIIQYAKIMILFNILHSSLILHQPPVPPQPHRGAEGGGEELAAVGVEAVGQGKVAEGGVGCQEGR